MSNQIIIESVEIRRLHDGFTEFAVFLDDEYDTTLSMGWSSIPHSNLELFKELYKKNNDHFHGIVDSIFLAQKGATINNTYYEYEELQKAVDCVVDEEEGDKQ